MTDINDDKAASTALEMVPGTRLNFPTYDGEIQFAQLMAKANILPAHLQGNPGNCLAVITMAQSWNMNPIMVGLKTSVIPRKGGGTTLMFEGQLVNAAINNSKALQGRLRFNLTGEGQATICEAVGRLKGESEDRTVNVHMPKTQNSPLWSGNQGDKEQQLTYLASRVWCRRHLPEILLGVYTPEDDWAEREPDGVTERRASVQSRVAHLDAQPKPDDSGRDDFIEGASITLEAGAIPPQNTVPVEKWMDRKNPDGSVDKIPIINTVAKDVRVSGGPPDPLEEPIPEFTVNTTPGGLNISDDGGDTFKCASCDGRGIIENVEGDKEPCPDCST